MHSKHVCVAVSGKYPVGQVARHLVPYKNASFGAVVVQEEQLVEIRLQITHLTSQRTHKEVLVVGPY